MEPGIYPDLSNEAYHSDAAISRSGIMSFLDSPYKYWADYLNPNKEAKEPTPAMEFGTDFHTLILEPDNFPQKYQNLSTKKLKNDYEVLHNMMWSLHNHSRAWDLIENNQYEQSYFWRDAHTGIMCKARPDILSDNYVIDLKTIANASPLSFQRAMADGGYHIQAAMIRDAIRIIKGRDIKSFINICVEKTYPYQIGIYFIEDEALEIGRQEYKQALLDMKSCFEQKEWPSYPIQTIGLPNWRKK